MFHPFCTLHHGSSHLSNSLPIVLLSNDASHHPYSYKLVPAFFYLSELASPFILAESALRKPARP